MKTTYAIIALIFLVICYWWSHEPNTHIYYNNTNSVNICPNVDTNTQVITIVSDIDDTIRDTGFTESKRRGVANVILGIKPYKKILVPKCLCRKLFAVAKSLFISSASSNRSRYIISSVDNFSSCNALESIVSTLY